MRAPFAEWRPIQTNFRPGGMKRPMMGLVLHHTVGSLESAERRFRTPGSGASAHFGVAYDGTVWQWVDTDDVAYAQCAGNWAGWVSVENESPADGDDLFPPLTAAQVASCHQIFSWLVGTEGIPNQVTDDVNTGGLAYHSMDPGACDRHWGLTGCPGDAIIAQRADIVAGTTPTPTPPKPKGLPYMKIIHTENSDLGPGGVYTVTPTYVQHVGNPQQAGALLHAGWEDVPDVQTVEDCNALKAYYDALPKPGGGVPAQTFTIELAGTAKP